MRTVRQLRIRICNTAVQVQKVVPKVRTAQSAETTPGPLHRVLLHPCGWIA